MRDIDVAVIGGGPAGMAAAVEAHDSGCSNVLLIERDRELGGILNQCVHDGFGNFIFGISLTGPEYAHRFNGEVAARPGIEVLTRTMVLDLHADRRITAVNSGGVIRIRPPAVILAMGCRERSRFQTVIPGYRPAGVITAGTAQRLINMEGIMPGERVVILGSGDVGLIMARRLTLEGAKVLGVYEIADRPSGLTRNVVQCLDDYGIPLHLSQTVTFIHGKNRLEGVTVAPVDGTGKPLKSDERHVACDTLILSVGLIPENELSGKAGVQLDPLTGGPLVDQDMCTGIPGIFASGNVVHVHDLVDYVSLTARRAGRGAHAYINGRRPHGRAAVTAGNNVAYVVPQHLSLPLEGRIDLYLRVKRELRDTRLKVTCGDNTILEKKERILRPPEMVHLELEAAALHGISTGEEIRIDAEKEVGER